jgi:DNA-cytosine methyltransferase
MYKTIRPETTIIEGRLVNQKDTYTLVWKTEKRKQDKAFYEDGYIWYPIKEVTKRGGVEVVYNIQVANDHSYTANGAIVHNCQDFSSAGLQRGGTEGSGTRSSLLWECRRAILAKKPKYLLLENVAALVSQKFLPLFNKWQAELERYGYTNYAQVLNAKDYGVPQNRDRIFLVSIRDQHPKYHFPKPFPLTLKLKDVLETEVDEKYYLSDTIVKGFEAHRNRMEERGNVVASSVLTNAGSRHCDNYIIEKDPRQMEMFETESEPLNPADGVVSRTIKAQYYKNSTANFFEEGSYGATGVVEYANKKV